MAKKSTFRLYWDDASQNANEKSQGWYIRLHRLLGYPFFWSWYKLGLTANSATFAGFLVELIGVWFFLTSHYFLAAAFIFGGVIFDNFDGSLARIRKEVGTLCATLACSAHHLFTPTLVLVGGFINYYFLTGDIEVLFLALLVGVTSAMTFQLMSIRSRALYKYFPRHALDNDQIIPKDKSKKKSPMLLIGLVSESTLNHLYLMILLYAFAPLVFIYFYSVLMPLRYVGFYVLSYIESKKLEKKFSKK